MGSEAFDVAGEVAERLHRMLCIRLGAFGPFVHLGHGGEDHAAGREQERVVGLGPGGEFGSGVDRDRRERLGAHDARVRAHCLSNECALGAEESKERDFVDSRFIGDAARGGAAKAGFGVDARGGFEDLRSSGIGHWDFVKSFTTQVTTCIQRKRRSVCFADDSANRY